jgi:hypothetical protein
VVEATDPPTESLTQAIEKSEMHALKPHLGEPTDVAEAVAIRHSVVLGQADLQRYVTVVGNRNLRRQKAIVGPRGRATNLPYLALPPVIAPDQTDIRSLSRLDLLEISFRKLNRNKAMRAVR